MPNSNFSVEKIGSTSRDQEHPEVSYSNRSNEQRPQKTISELFATSKHRSEDIEGTTPTKRLKRDHSSTALDGSPTSLRTMKQEEMYSSFPTTKPRASEVIEISDDERPCQFHSVQNPTGGAAKPANFTPRTGLKKLIVKNLRKTPRADPEQYYNRVWEQLDSALSSIFGDKGEPYSMEELYRGVEILCRQGRSSSLFQRLCDKCKQACAGLELPLVAIMRVGSDVEVLRGVVKAWSTWNTQLATVRSIFFYLDRSYLLHSASLPSIEEMATTEFRTQVFSNTSLKSHILEGACDLLNTDRKGSQDSVGAELFRNAITMFHGLSVYSKDFEPVMMDDSATYLASWANKESSSNTLAGYVEACHKLIVRELHRCDAFGLDLTTRKRLEAYLEDILIEQRKEQLLKAEEISALLEQDAADALETLYSLLQRRSLAENLRPPFEAFIAQKGSKIVFDEEREQEMVVRLLDFKRKLDLIWAHSFKMHEGLGHSLRQAFEAFINKSKRSNMTWGTDNPKPGEMIAKYVDMILKGGAKAIPATLSSADTNTRTPKLEDAEASSDDEDVEITKQLDQVLDLFRFVHGKAVFEAFYKRDLARRLLLGRSASGDAEKSMLTRLKSECGAGFTHNLEQMFRDMELAREEISSYKSMLEEKQAKQSVDFNVSVLSSSAWPSYSDVALELPRNIQKATAGFELFYKLKHSGRKLTWKHSLAHCQLKASFPRSNKELVVSSYQAIVLLLFNDKAPDEQVSYVEIQATTNLDDDELKRTLQSLACAKHRVLSKSPKGKDVNDSDVFAINLNFWDRKYRVKINQIQAKETKEENKETHERVAADRNYETQAAIVRIMKTRKTITHAELVSEVIIATKSRGVLDPVDIKRNIEKLIEKDYMEREENNDGRNAYNYMA